MDKDAVSGAGAGVQSDAGRTCLDAAPTLVDTVPGLLGWNDKRATSLAALDFDDAGVEA